MDNDKLLLENAAKSLGEYAQLLLKQGKWNPLTDDGDALRLAVKLGFIDEGCWPLITGALYDECNGDWYAATRRAIVRAAAHIGESMV